VAALRGARATVGSPPEAGAEQCDVAKSLVGLDGVHLLFDNEVPPRLSPGEPVPQVQSVTDRVCVELDQVQRLGVGLPTGDGVCSLR